MGLRSEKVHKCRTHGARYRHRRVLHFKCARFASKIACLRVNRVKAYQKTGTGQRDLSSMGRRKARQSTSPSANTTR